MEKAMSLSVKQLKQILSQRGVDISDCLEKSDLAKKYVETCRTVGKVYTRTTKVGDLNCTVLDKEGEDSSSRIGIILMHGYGANRHDLLPFMNGLLQNYTSPSKSTIRCILPDAPIPIDGNSSSLAWFPLNIIQLATTPPPQLAEMTLPGLNEACEKVKQLAKNLKEDGFD